MYCIACRRVLPSLTQEQRDHLRAYAALQSLAELLEAVPDPRGAHGLRYDLPFLLVCLVAALLCHCDGTEAVAPWCRDHVARLARRVWSPTLPHPQWLAVSLALAAGGSHAMRNELLNL